MEAETINFLASVLLGILIGMWIGVFCGIRIEEKITEKFIIENVRLQDRIRYLENLVNGYEALQRADETLEESRKLREELETEELERRIDNGLF